MSEARIRAIICPADPQLEPYITMLDNTLEAMQTADGGYVEFIRMPGYMLLCNEE